MADAITIQELIDARTDAKTLEEAVNGDAVTTVLSRLGESYPTLANALSQIDGKLDSADAQINQGITNLFENGGLPATPFKTKALMTASSLANDKYAMVTDDTANNGLYIKTAGAWVKSAYDPTALANTYTDNKVKGVTNNFKTKALMTASALPNDSYAMVTDDTEANNGWYSKVAGAWVKSGYDPLAQAKAYTDNLKTVLDISALTRNYAMTLTEAIASVPINFRKVNAIIKFNDNEQYAFQGAYTEERFNSIRYWIRPSHKDSLNKFNASMIYRGFNSKVGAAADDMEFGADKAIAIVPINRFYIDGALQPLSITFEDWDATTAEKAGFMDADLKVVQTFALSQLRGITIPGAAQYVFFNVADGAIDNTENTKYVRYTEAKYRDLSNLELNDNLLIDVDNDKKGLTKHLTSKGDAFYSTEKDIFVNPLTRFTDGVGGATLAEAVIDVYTDVKNNASVFASNGMMRKICILRMDLRPNAFVAKIGIEDKDVPGLIIEYGALPESYNGVDFASSNRVLLKASASDGLDVFLQVNPKVLWGGGTSIYLTSEQGMVKDSYILKRYNEKLISNYDRFDMFEVAKTKFQSNYEYLPPANKSPETWLVDGVKSYTLTGTSNISKHEQCALVSSKRIGINGSKSLTVFCSTESNPSYSQPALKVIRSPSALSNSNEVLGQYVHPDVLCVPEGFMGYKYWMVNSAYPYSNPTTEDAEIFVSNDGLSWERILHPDEGYTTNIPLRIPPTYWSIYDPKYYSERYRFFMPIPRGGVDMEFATKSGVALQTIRSGLNHDPAISFHDGWLNIYITYNIAIEVAAKNHRYTVCYRTQDFVNWQVVREDGTAFDYNELSAQTIFSSTSGVRNHIYYANNPTDSDVSKQFVKVSDAEWYCYAVITEASGAVLVRYTGTSPYIFDWSTYQRCTITPVNTQRLWHIAVKHIDGKFYFMYSGYLTSSVDGINFTNSTVPIVRAGMQGVVYKPYFVKGHDGKLKVGASVITSTGVVEPYVGTSSSFKNTFSRQKNVPVTVNLEYPSIAYAIELGESVRDNAFVDVVVSINRERTRQTFIHYMAGLKGQTTLKGIELREGDYVRVVAYLNTSGKGVANFEGVLIDDRT